MRIAIPIADERLAMHFGHCAQFALIDADPEQKTILKQEVIDAPPHVPGLLPHWLGERGVTVIIAGGMGARAQELFAEQNIQVVIGAPPEPAEWLVSEFLNGTLIAGVNICDH
jgi:predicted Fe-Mo cluster-binding NifX family protein